MISIPRISLRHILSSVATRLTLVTRPTTKRQITRELLVPTTPSQTKGERQKSPCPLFKWKANATVVARWT